MRQTVFNELEAVPVTIASGTSLSAAVNCGGLRLFGLVMPAAWTTANLTFQMSHDGGATWVNMYDASGTELTTPAAASRFIAVDPAQFAAVTLIKVRSGSAATAVNQAQDAVVSLILRSV